MARYDDRYSDPYWDEYGSAPPSADPYVAPEPTSYRGGVTILGWAPQGNEWIPVYRGTDGNLYTGSSDNWVPFTGDAGSLQTGDGPAGQPTWAPGAPAPSTASDTYQENVQRTNTAAREAALRSSGGYGGGGSSSRGPSIDPSYLAPWMETFRPPAGSELPGYTPPPAFSYQDFQMPEQFQPITAQDLLKDPSYLWREGRIRDNIENSAAARGLLGSSGTLYDIGSAAGNFASQEYGAANDRAWQQWAGNFDAALKGYKTNRGNALDTYATNYGVNKDTYGLLTQRSNDIYDRAWQMFNDRRNTFYANQDRPADKLFRAMDIGARAAAY